MTEPTDAQIEAGARALAKTHFCDGTEQPFERFSDYDRKLFRLKARAVWEAMTADVKQGAETRRAKA